jgi:ketosteroid isomerase-like protein
MLKFILPLALALSSTSCVIAVGNSGSIGDAANSQLREDSFHEVMAEMTAAYDSGEIREVFLESIVESDEVIVIGSLASEWTVGIEAIREGMSGGGGTVKYIGRDLHDSHLELSKDRTVGWLTELADLHYDVNGEKKSLMGFRATSVWEHADGEWKIVNFHGSMPDVANDF